MKSGLLLFVKQPVQGKVKTRLQGDFDENLKLNLYKCFVEDMARASLAANATSYLCYAPESAQTFFQTWLGESFQYHNQYEGDLGERMSTAFQMAFRDGCNKVIVVGSDCPELSPTLLQSAFDALNSTKAVIGPAEDGGYYLLGFTEQGFHKEVFQNIQWSTSEVFSQTVQRLNDKGVDFTKLAVLNDIDTLDDLAGLWQRIQQGEETGASTSNFLLTHSEHFFGSNSSTE